MPAFIDLHAPPEGWEQDAEARFGVKGASLLRMAQMGLPVPEGILFDRATCAACFGAAAERGGEPEAGEPEGEAFEALLEEAEAWLARAGGGPAWSLGLAVRSSPSQTAPGLLPTLLAVGLKGASWEGPIGPGPSRSVLDARRVFLESYALAHGIAPSLITRARSAANPRSWRSPRELEVGALRRIVEDLTATLRGQGRALPVSPAEERRASIAAVLRSSRALLRKDPTGAEGFALVLQRMVRANEEQLAGAGVAYSRHPVTGVAGLGGDFLRACLGVAVVGGRSSPERLLRRNARGGREEETLEACCPALIAPLAAATDALEARLRAPVEIEIAVEEGRLFFLQHRIAALAPGALAKALVEMEAEGRITVEEALAQVSEATLAALFEPRLPELDVLAAREIVPLATGLAASQGVATGALVFEPEEVAGKIAEGQAVILARAETRAEDALGLRAATGILTTAGGLTCHGAVIARALRKPCVVGASSLRVDYEGGRVLRGEEVVLRVGDRLTIDGSTGRVFAGAVEVEDHPLVPESVRVRGWFLSKREGDFPSESR